MSLNRDSIFLTLGPYLPRNLKLFSMLEIYEDLYVFGGDIGHQSDFQTSIYRLSCCSGDCSWSIINKQMKEARKNVVIPVPEHFCT